MPLRIMHILRAPLGGLFRHVRDLAEEQIARGHAVGIVADSDTGGAEADAVFAQLAPRLALGLTRVPISRQIGLSDIRAFRTVSRKVRETQPDVIHGHGAKGGAFARLVRQGHAIRVYTPHGGSLNYKPESLVGRVYLTLEKILKTRTELFLFESRYAREVFRAKVGETGAQVRVVHNGVRAEEFAPVVMDNDATDLVFVGELREAKGADVLIEAIAALKQSGRRVSATIVGAGPDAAALRARADRLGLAIRFPGALPARAGFARGHTVVIPSRAESLPYIVLEAVAAARPLVTTNVGGIPEIFGAQADRLVAAGSAAALATAIAATLDQPEPVREAALTLRERIRVEFITEVMAESVLEAYQAAIALLV
jgi:glycosyltransferase involved in cell wall biosynthesis